MEKTNTKYSEAVCEVITFASTDVITTSEPVINLVPELPFDEL